MRILHTSDWHLGRGLHGTDLHDAQVAVMGRIVELVDEESIDVVVVAGDVYDRSVPPVDSVRLLSDTLADLCVRVPVIMTPGNHDSATRLGFGARLFRERLHIRNSATDVATPVILSDAHGEVAFYPVPYLDPEEARRILAPEGEVIERSHAAVMSRAMGLIRADLAARGSPRSVVVAHAFVVGSGGREASQTSDSERDITVGTLDNMPSDVFDGATYVALGHLHGRQSLSPTASGTVLAYSGSPLRYSFSEAGHDKGVTIVDIDALGAVSSRHVSLDQPRAMARIRGALEDLVDAGGRFAVHRDSWVQVTVTDRVRPDEMVARLRAQFPHALVVRHEPEGRDTGADSSVGAAAAAASPRDVLAGFVTEVGGATPTSDELLLLDRAIAEIFAEGR